jgi:hypothetical protein
MSLDPITFASAAATAGFEQSQNEFSGYGQGAKGFAKRFGASYGDGFNSMMIGDAILPSLLHQDPRYLYKGTGSIRSRALYAISATSPPQESRTSTTHPPTETARNSPSTTRSLPLPPAHSAHYSKSS